MAANPAEVVAAPRRTAGFVEGREATRYGAMLAVHTTLANPFAIAVLVLVIGGVLLLRRQRRG